MRDPNCVFCKITREDSPTGLITEWEDAIALHPLNPVVEGHVLIIPRVHVENFATDWHVTSITAGRACEFVSKRLHMHDFNLITSKGRSATQTVFHLHMHLVPRHPGDGLALPWTGEAA
jgi:histidine triad (HIT) family protein